MNEKEKFSDWAKDNGYSLCTFKGAKRDGRLFVQRSRDAEAGWIARAEIAEKRESELFAEVERLREALALKHSVIAIEPDNKALRGEVEG